MSEPHVVSALKSKHAEIAGEIAHLQKIIEEKESDLEHVRGSLRLFDPTFDYRSIRKKQVRSKNRFFEYGEARRHCLDILRESDRPLSSAKIASMIAEHTGMEIPEEDWDCYQKTVTNALHPLRRKGTVIVAGQENNNRSYLWELAIRSGKN